MLVNFHLPTADQFSVAVDTGRYERPDSELTNPDATTGRTTLRRSFAAAPMGVAQRRDAEESR